MEVRATRDPAELLARAEPFLLVDEARHSLILGIAGGLLTHPRLYDELRAWTIEDEGEVVGAALQTPPFNLVLARPSAEGALEALAATLAAEDVELPGVTAATPEVDDFARLWTSAGRLTSRVRTRQRIYKLTRVRSPRAPGRARTATAGDRELLLDWTMAFAAEAVGVDDPAIATRQVEARLDHGVGGFALWEHEHRPVSMVGWGGMTRNGGRIGPVYTPPELRRRGYASALTAWVSAKQLAEGRSFCVLYTDLDNPTSNRIYLDIGYEPVCDSLAYVFEPLPDAEP